MQTPALVPSFTLIFFRHNIIKLHAWLYFVQKGKLIQVYLLPMSGEADWTLIPTYWQWLNKHWLQPYAHDYVMQIYDDNLTGSKSCKSLASWVMDLHKEIHEFRGFPWILGLDYFTWLSFSSTCQIIEPSDSNKISKFMRLFRHNSRNW